MAFCYKNYIRMVNSMIHAQMRGTSGTVNNNTARDAMQQRNVLLRDWLELRDGTLGPTFAVIASPRNYKSIIPKNWTVFNMNTKRNVA